MLIGPARIIDKRTIFILSLSRTPLNSPFSGPPFLRGRREEHLALADISFPLVFSLLILGTERECEYTELRGGEALGTEMLELYQEVLGIGSRGFLGIESLLFTALFLGTVLFLDTVRFGSTR